MKKICGLALILLLALSLCACGGDSEEAEVDYNFVGQWVYEDYDMALSFYTDESWDVLDYSGEMLAYGTYIVAGDSATLYDETDTEIMTCTVTADGGLVDSDGDALYLDNEWAPEGIGEEEYGFYPEDDGGISYEEMDDGTMWCNSSDCNVSFCCPDWMAVGNIGDTTDAVVAYDLDDGYVVIDNMTNEWESYAGSDDDFLADYLDSYFDEFFGTIYGLADDGDWEYVNPDKDTWMSSLEGNFWNADYDIYFRAVVLAASDDSVMVECCFAPCGEDDQFQTLWAEVTDIEGVY